MRLIAFILAAFVASGPAAAQNWKEYSYPGYAFSVAFPADPKIETATYQLADGRSVGARVYSITQDNAVFRMTIAELADIALEESAVVDHAIKTLTQSSEIKVDIPHRIRQVYGRQLSIAGADGSHSFIAAFYYKRRLYQIEGKALPTGDDARADAMRFQQSLDFTENASHRLIPASKAETRGRLFAST